MFGCSIWIKNASDHFSRYTVFVSITLYSVLLKSEHMKPQMKSNLWNIWLK